MIKELSVKNFKNLENTGATLSNINILTGVNGRGKSSFLQTLLMLSQTWINNQYRNLLPQGCWKSLGVFDDIRNSFCGEENIEIRIKTDDPGENDFVLEYTKNPDKETLGELAAFNVNGNSVIVSENEEMGEDDESHNSDEYSETPDNPSMLASIADYAPLTKLKKLFYISSDRMAAKAKEQLDENTAFLNPDGSNILNYLYKQDKETVKEVESLLNEIFGGAVINIDLNDQDIVLRLNSENGTKLYRPENVGFGFSYVLSVATAIVISQHQDILIIENPEAHLHPSAQSMILHLLIQNALKKGYQLFVETHSDHVVNATLLEVKRKDNKCNRENVEILFFSNVPSEIGESQSKIKNLTISPSGKILNPPRQFFDQYAKDLRELYS